MKVGKFVYDFYQLSVDGNTDVRCCSSSGQLYVDLRLFATDLHPEAFVFIRIQVSQSIDASGSQHVGGGTLCW